MEKSRFAFEKFVEFENFMEWGHAPKCLLEELAEFARYLKNDDWAEHKAVYMKVTQTVHI